MTYRKAWVTGGGGSSAWADITGRPSTFTPSTHEHAIDNVTGLQTALDGKQAAGNYALAGQVQPVGFHYLNVLPAGSFVTNALDATAMTTIAAAANRLDFIPFIPAKALTIDQVTLEVTTGVASSLARVGIYADSNGPAARLAEGATTLDCATTGSKTAAVSFTFTAGTTYWLDVLSSSTQTYRGLSVASLIPLGLPVTGTAFNTLRRATSTFASGLPANAPATTLTASIAPVVRLRVG